MGAKISAITMTTAGSRQYHIGLSRGELAERILLCGEPARAERTAAIFDKVHVERKEREFITFTGRYRGHEVSVMSTGIGPDNTEIAVIETLRLTRKPVFIRIGSCGALKKGVRLGELVISTGAVRLENTSLFYVPSGYPAVAHYEIINALIAAAKRNRVKYHVGLTATAPGFYAAQGRETVYPLTAETKMLWRRLAELNVLNLEMECSTLFTLCAIRGLRAGAVCAVYAERWSDTAISDAEKKRAEKNCIRVGLEAICSVPIKES